MKTYSVRTLVVILVAICSFAVLARAQDFAYQVAGEPGPNATLIENQLVVKTTVPSTYYSLVYNAWGYGGFQMNQTNATRRAIISLWNQNNAQGQQEASSIYAFNSTLPTTQNNGFCCGEGAGVHFLYDYNWKYNTIYRMALRAFVEADNTHMRFSGFVYDGSTKTWTYAVTERANTLGQAFPGTPNCNPATASLCNGPIASFAESFGGVTGERDATMSNAWSYIPSSGWTKYDTGYTVNDPDGNFNYGGIYSSSDGLEFKSGPQSSLFMPNGTQVSYASGDEYPIVVPFNLTCGNLNSEQNWEADAYWKDTSAMGDTAISSFFATVNLSKIPNPGPPQVYRNLRTGSSFQYNLFGFIPLQSYTVTLQFVDPIATAAGQRGEDVTINGTKVLADFDIFKTAGAKNVAVEQTFTVTATASGEIIVQFAKATGSSLPAAITAISTADVSGSGTAVSLSATSLTFAPQTVGTTSAAQVVALKNLGPGVLTIMNITPSASFAQTNNCSTTLASGASCNINVTMTPLWGGTMAGALTVTDDANTLVQTVSLAGTGTGGTGADLVNGTYTITNSVSGLVWDNSAASGSLGYPNIDLATANNDASQKWILTGLGYGKYEILNAENSQSLNDPGNSTKAGTELIEYPYQASANETWLLTPSGSGYVITEEANKMAIDPAGDTLGSAIVLEPASGAATQVWLIK